MTYTRRPFDASDLSERHYEGLRDSLKGMRMFVASEYRAVGHYHDRRFLGIWPRDLRQFSSTL